MNRKALIAIVSTGLLTACGSDEPIDLRQVLDRTVAVLEFAHDRFKDVVSDNEPATDEQMRPVAALLSEVLNQRPRFYDGTISVELREDATFEGYSDANGDGVQDSGEKTLFTIEVDSENRRLIATDESGQSIDFGGAGKGFLAGALISNLLGRQSRAGIKPGHFDNRPVVSESAYGRARPRYGSARSRSGTGSFKSSK